MPEGLAARAEDGEGVHGPAETKEDGAGEGCTEGCESRGGD